MEKFLPPGLIDEPNIKFKAKENFLTGEELDNLNLDDDDDDSSVSDNGSTKRIEQVFKEPEIKLKAKSPTKLKATSTKFVPKAFTPSTNLSGQSSEKKIPEFSQKHIP